eukprot:scaffold48964_cov109-Cyclotella_meneghiniana.AAC.1
MFRRIKSCQSCRKRFTTAKGASLCLTCRQPANEKATDASSAKIGCKPVAVDAGNAHVVESEKRSKDCNFMTSYMGGDGDESGAISSTNKHIQHDACGSVTPHAVSLHSARIAEDKIPNAIETNTQEIVFHRKRQWGENVLQVNEVKYKKPRVSYDTSECKDANSCRNEEPLFTQSIDHDDIAGATNFNEPISNLNNQNKNTTEYSHLKQATLDEPAYGDDFNDIDIHEYENKFDYESECDVVNLDKPAKFNSTDSDQNDLFDDNDCNGSDGDDSEIICWDASELDPSFIMDDDKDMAKQSRSTLADVQSSPNLPKDVCYICGNDLSKLSTGIRGRVAHMKRCSAKHGKIFLGNDDDNFIPSPEEEPHLELSAKNCDQVMLNPYSKDRWHGDANIDLEANNAARELATTDKNQPKQTALDKFFKAPVKSLTNVLMAGSKKLAKSKSIEAKQKVDASKGKSRGKWSGGGGGWRSNHSRGSCPGYKKIPGTDFICDGFYYARLD